MKEENCETRITMRHLASNFNEPPTIVVGWESNAISAVDKSGMTSQNNACV